MTRFARAKGSKSSNERLPEEATSWKEMKQQLEDKKQEVEDEKKRKKAEEVRKENYKNFLEELEGSKEESWAEIETEKKSESNPVVKKGKKRKLSEVESKDVNSVKEVKEVNGKSIKKDNKKKIKGNKKKVEEKKVVKKAYADLTEEERKKVDKKREKRAKQVEKRKLFKNTQTQPNDNIITKKKPPISKDNKEHKRRKPQQKETTININGTEIKITIFDGFPIKVEDAERLRQLRKDMISKGIPRSEIQTALKLERRKAEKALAREKKKVCFNCRKSGHVLSECPNLNENHQEMIGSGVCFKCGSTEHTHFECKVVRTDNYKFATCFICKEQGHISRQCPDNDKGLYPKGGACKVCGDVTHLKKDCPKYQAQQEALKIEGDTINFDNIESLDVKNNDVNGDFGRNVSPQKIIKY